MNVKIIINAFLLLFITVFVHNTYAGNDNWQCHLSFVDCGSDFYIESEAIEAGQAAAATYDPDFGTCPLAAPVETTESIPIGHGNRITWSVVPVWDGTPEHSYCQPGVWGIQLWEHRCDSNAYWDSSSHLCILIPNCPAGEAFSKDTEMCIPFSEPKNNGPCKQCAQEAGEPVNLGTGNLYVTETDYLSPVPNGLTYRRYYNSQWDGRIKLVGHGWNTDYRQIIFDTGGGTLASVWRPNGKIYIYHQDGTAWVSDPDVTLKLVELTDGQGSRTGWQLTLDDDTVEIYNYDPVKKVARPISITDRAGLTTTLTYDLSVAEGGDDDPNTLDRVTDPFGRTLNFQTTNGTVTAMVDPDGNVFTYTRDLNSNLVSVTYPDDTPGDSTDNPARTYHYEDSNYPNALTGITDENNNRIDTWAYNIQKQAILTEHAGGADRIDITYNMDGTTTTTNSLGQVQTFHFDVLHDTVNITQIDGDYCATCGGQFQSITYDANGFVASRTDFNGNVTTYVHDARGLETTRTEAVGTPEERTITTTWDTTFRLPLTITEPGQITTFTYDAQGRLLSREVSIP